MTDWTLEQATELVFEQILMLLDGCDDGDVVRPGLVFDAIKQAWSPGSTDEIPAMTAGEMRTRTRAAIAELAGGAKIP